MVNKTRYKTFPRFHARKLIGGKQIAGPLRNSEEQAMKDKIMLDRINIEYRLGRITLHEARSQTWKLNTAGTYFENDLNEWGFQTRPPIVVNGPCAVIKCYNPHKDESKFCYYHDALFKNLDEVDLGPAKCAGPSCDKPIVAKGLCRAHYKQQYMGHRLSPIKLD